ncbi:MAG: hypothetical protein AAF502_15635 [Bacteroidota bacterium]
MEEVSTLKINTINSALGGNHSMHSNSLLLHKIIPFAPDMVVLKHNINDVTTLAYEQSYHNRNWHRSLLINNTLDQPKDLKEEWVGMKPVFNADFVSKFSKSLDLFISLCQINEISPVLLTQPLFLQDSLFEKSSPEVKKRFNYSNENYSEFRKMVNSFNMVILSKADQQGVHVIDLAASIPKSNQYFYDYVHLTDEGSIKVAEFLAPEILKIVEKTQAD